MVQADGLLGDAHVEAHVGPYGVVSLQVLLKPGIELYVILRRLLQPVVGCRESADTGL